MSDYQKLVAEETLTFEATEAICEHMDRDDGLTRKALAARLGKSKGFVTQILAGDRNMTLRTLARFADALGCKAEVKLTPIPAPPGDKPSVASTSFPEDVHERVEAAVAAKLSEMGIERPTDEEIAERRNDPAFRARLERSIEENRELLDRLAAPTPEQPEEPTCGASGILSGSGNPYDEDPIVECPGCPDCSAQEPAGEEEPRASVNTKIEELQSVERACGRTGSLIDMRDWDPGHRNFVNGMLFVLEKIPAEWDSRLTKEQCREKLLSAIASARQGHVRGPNPLSVEGDLFRTERESGAGVQVIALDDFNKALDDAFGDDR